MKKHLLACAGILSIGAAGAAAGDFETAAIQARIDETSARGGGVVSIPAGRHVVGQLDLKSGVELHLEKGAVLEGTSDRSAYPKFTRPYSEGDWMGVVIATNAHDIAVTGEGTILGNGWTWVDLATHEAGSEGLRPRGLVFADCRNVRLEGFKLLDSASWGIVFHKVDGVVARRVTIDNHCTSNNDGFDIEARNVLIEDCDIDASDDAIVLKSNCPDYTVENVVVRRCISRSTGNAFKLGTASHGVMRNVLFEDCRGEMARRSHPDPRNGQEWWESWRANWLNASKTLAGLNGFTAQCVDGGIVENVTIRRCSLNGYNVPIFIRGGERPSRIWNIPAGDKWILRNILVEDVTGSAESSVASSITGAGRCRPQNVTLRNVKIVCKGAGDLYVPHEVPDAKGSYPSSVIFAKGLPAWGLYIRHADGVRLENADFELVGDDKREKIAADDATLTYGTDIAVERPQIPWLFGGFGFQNAEARLTPLMTESFRDERAVKSFRELSPSFSRVYVGMNGESKESLDRFADYYDKTFRPCDTTIYAVGGAMPAFADKLDIEAHAEGVAKSLEYLVKERDCRKIRFYCLTNELMSGDEWGYFWFQRKMDLFKEFHQALYDAFRRHGLDIQLAASDGSYGRKQAEELKWTVDNMDLITGIYCTHYYDGDVKPGDVDAYGIFSDQFTNIVTLAMGKTKRWMLGEFGIVPPREKGVMVDDRNWNGVDPQRSGLAALTMAEMAMAAINAGAYAVMSWSFCDYPDPFVVEDSHDPAGHARYESGKAVYKPDMKYNKWGVFRWSDVNRDFGPNPTYFTLGLMSRYFRKGANVLTAKASDPLVRATVLQNRDGTMTAAVVNLGERRDITLSGWETSPRGARLYLYDSANPRLNPFGDLPPADCVLTPDGGAVRFEIPENGMAFVTTDYVERVPTPVKDVKVADGRLTWTPVDDPDHCYYRVYENGSQIASTVATSLPVKTDDVSSFTVKSVDKWGNEGR